MTAPAGSPHLLGEHDAAWIDRIVDVAVACTGLPWRTLRERLEHGEISASRVAVVLAALRLATGGGAADRARIARQVRGLVLGAPALDEAARSARIGAAAEQLGLDARGIEELMWVDLANERPVVFPRGRPAALDVAAQANLDRIQRALRRARRVRLRLWSDAHDLIRMIRRRGLVTTVTRASGGVTVLDILGPLALFHDTGVYGRALGAIAPLLADHARFELELACDLGYGPTRMQIAPPVLLPPASVDRLARSQVARLARAFDRLDIDLERDPRPLAYGVDVLYPELAVRTRGRRWLVELLGFATAEHLASRLALYRAAGAGDVVLCVPARRAPKVPEDPHVFRFERRLEATALVAHIERLP